MKRDLHIMRASLTIVAILLTLIAAAKGIGEEAARQKAIAFMHNQFSMPKGAKMRRVAMPTEALSLTSAGIGTSADGGQSYTADNQPLYIFNCEGGGYVIVSGDDRTFSILGYSSTGEIDPETMPANMRAWLASYADAITNLDESVTAIAPRTPAKVKAAIKPASKTTWNQVDPYNRTVPYYTYTYEGRVYSEPAVTGCGATALAQVMYYHRYPDAVQANIPGYDGECDVDLGVSTVKGYYTAESIAKGTPIDWDNILPSYERGTTYTTTQANAVAHLMQYVGTAAKMLYGPESGVYNLDLLYAIVNAFGYKDAYIVYASSFDTYEEWVDRVYDEVLTSKVISFNGKTINGKGHIFLLDGYEGEDYFHVNWGWGGILDGYFKLALMDPGIHQGTGGSTEGYSVNQNFITGLGPGGKGLTTMEKRYEAISLTWGEEGKAYTLKSYGKYDIPDLRVEFGNYNFYVIDSYPDVGFFDADGNIVMIINLGHHINVDQGAPLSVPLSWHYRYTYNNINVPAERFPDGTYTVKPICSLSVDDDEDWQPMYRADRATLYLTIANGTATVSTSNPTSIDTPKAQGAAPASSAVEGIYTIGGAKVPSMQKGINIVRRADGSVVKVVK